MQSSPTKSQQSAHLQEAQIEERKDSEGSLVDKAEYEEERKQTYKTGVTSGKVPIDSSKDQFIDLTDDKRAAKAKIRVLFLGDEGVGKTSIIVTLISDTFPK